MGDAITIPKKVYERVLKKIEANFYKEFGNNKEPIVFTRDELILQYAKYIRFWDTNIPKVQPGLSIQDIAAHAIATNAKKNLLGKIRELDIEDEVCAQTEELS